VRRLLIFSTMADMISNFPDDILLYILSFVPTKQVVVTSILCKRWNLLWRSVPSFDFHYEDLFDYDQEFDDDTHFLKSVDSFLLCRDTDQPIHRFRVNCFFNSYDPTYIVPWVKAAMSGRVQHMDFSLVSMNVLLSVVFSCKTLVVLKLAFLIVESIHLFELPSLKILHLNYVNYLHSEVIAIDLSKLFSRSPNLEDLVVKYTYICHESKFNRLPKLIRANIDALVPTEIVKNVQVLFIDWVIVKNACGFFLLLLFISEKKGFLMFGY